MSGRRAKLFHKLESLAGMNPRHLADAAHGRPPEEKAMGYRRMSEAVKELRARRDKRTEEQIAKEFLRQATKGL